MSGAALVKYLPIRGSYAGLQNIVSWNVQGLYGNRTTLQNPLALDGISIIITPIDSTNPILFKLLIEQNDYSGGYHPVCEFFVFVPGAGSLITPVVIPFQFDPNRGVFARVANVSNANIETLRIGFSFQLSS